MAWVCGIERPAQPSPCAVLVGGRFVGVQPRSSAGLEGVRAAVAGGRSALPAEWECKGSEAAGRRFQSGVLHRLVQAYNTNQSVVLTRV